MSLESGNLSADIPPSDPWSTILLRHGATAERLPIVKSLLAKVGITHQNLPDLIEIYEGPTDIHQPFPGFGGTDKKIEDLAGRLQECKTSFKAHYSQFD